MKIGIVGAGGPSGLAVLRAAVRAKIRVAAFETRSKVGGVWAGTMYDSLMTNLPMECMAYSEFPCVSEAYVSRDRVLEYLGEYGSGLEEHIRFDSEVASVKPVQGGGGGGRRPKWEVRASDGSCDVVDAVFVTNGHYGVPYVPDFANNASQQSIHSSEYSNAEPYDERIVAIVGASSSGIDIALDVSKRAAFVHVFADKPPPFQAANVAFHPRLSAFENGFLICEDGSRVENVNDIIWCTGYEYDFPTGVPARINQDDRSLTGIDRRDPCRVLDYDNLYIIGLVYGVVPFPLVEAQAWFCLSDAAAAAASSSSSSSSSSRSAKTLLAEESRPHAQFSFKNKQFDYTRALLEDVNCELIRLPQATRAVALEEIEKRRRLYERASAARAKRPLTYRQR